MSTQRPPSVEHLARSLDNGGSAPHSVRVAVARTAIEAWRADNAIDVTAEAERLLAALIRTRPTRVINATGVVLHTNLGRAPLHPDAAAAAHEVAIGYGNVELDLATGKRGSRHGYMSQLITSATGAEAATVVNNNAGALMLALAALAAPDGVAVSRGELIEIGGSFRLPELMAASGCHLVEVGTTNRTRVADYAAAVDAVAILKVHPSNYRVEGFAEEAGYAELSALAAVRNVPFIVDVGSGLLDADTPWLQGAPPTWLAEEPGVRQTLQAGADVVVFSGDKLLGGPQCGIIAGKADVLARIAKHPMLRTMRLDGPTLAALTTTLELYATGRGAEIPFWQMVTVSNDDLTRRLEPVRLAVGDDATIIDDASLPGAGSVPGERIPTPVLEITQHVNAAFEALLAATPPILARRQAGTLVVDLRTVDETDDAHLATVLAGLSASD